MTQAIVEEAEVGGRSYRFSHIDPFAALDLAVEVKDVLAPLVGATAGSALAAKPGTPTEEILGSIGSGSDGVSAAVTEALRRVTKEQLRGWTKVIGSSCQVQVDGQWRYMTDETIKTVYRGDVGGMVAWLAKGLQVHLGSFFKGAEGTDAGSILRALTSRARGQNT